MRIEWRKVHAQGAADAGALRTVTVPHALPRWNARCAGRGRTFPGAGKLLIGLKETIKIRGSASAICNPVIFDDELHHPAGRAEPERNGFPGSEYFNAYPAGLPGRRLCFRD